LMSKTLSIESGQAHLSIQDAAVVLRSPGQNYPPTTQTILNASNFKAPGVQSFSAKITYDPMMVQIAGALCSGISGTAQSASTHFETVIHNCQVDNGHGQASFGVEVKGTPPTGGPAQMVTIALQAGVLANTSSSTLLNLAVTNVLDQNGTPISVTATPALVRFLSPGDFNGDGQVGIDDAIQVANAIMTALSDGCGMNVFAGPSLALTVPQLEAADATFPFATPQTNPPIFSSSDFSCANITSADVAAIARRSLLTGGASALAALQALAQPMPTKALQLENVVLMPGLLRGGGYAQLTARGYGIAGLELRCYDLAGRLVINEFSDGSRLRFQLRDGWGHPLARGVYLYLVTVRGTDGTVIQSGVRKLLVR